MLRLPFPEWSILLCAANTAACACAVPALADATSCELAVPAAVLPPVCLGTDEHAAERDVISCGGGGGGGSAAVCSVSRSITDAHNAAGVMLHHFGLSAPWLWGSPSHAALHSFLWPAARAARGQLWGLTSIFEPFSYYPAGRDPQIIAQFNVTAGFNRRAAAVFRREVYPNWERALHPFSLEAKLNSRIVPALSNVTLVQSNCNSRSGRETFLRDLLALLPVDSFGSCLGNRDEPAISSARIGFFPGMAIKHDLIYGYKFVLCFENSYEEDYVSEKILDAWEAHAVPIYRGAPNIEDFAIAPHSFIRVDEVTSPAELAALITYLDGNDTAYGEYHRWRDAPREVILRQSPLHALEELERRQTHLCALCEAVHAAAQL